MDGVMTTTITGTEIVPMKMVPIGRVERDGLQETRFRILEDGGKPTDVIVFYQSR